MSLDAAGDAHAADRVRVRDAFYENGRVVDVRNEGGEPRVALKIKSDGTQGGEDELFESFDATEVWIVSCEGPTEEWKVVEKVPLI